MCPYVVQSEKKPCASQSLCAYTCRATAENKMCKTINFQSDPCSTVSVPLSGGSSPILMDLDYYLLIPPVKILFMVQFSS